MVPPWVPDPVDPETPIPDETPAPPEDGENPPNKVVNRPPVPIAPPRRFASTRLSLGEYGRSGDGRSMRKGVGRYIGGGLGGSRTAVRRFGGTASTAASLYGALGGNVTGGSPQRERLEEGLRSGKSARGIINAVVEIVCPVDGTQDSEASRNSINDALAELLKRYPDADVLNLTEAQREFVVSWYVSMDVYRRFVLDVGGAIRDKAPSAVAGVSRLREVREYIRETVMASFEKSRKGGRALSSGQVIRTVKMALADAFDIFAEYSE